MNEELKMVLSYNPENGLFTWNKYVNPRQKCEAGAITSDGYIRIGYKGKYYRAHRLAFFFMNRKVPVQVDHKNHKRDDNRWINLKASNNKQNGRNQSKSIRNKSGYIGVSYDKKRDKWVATIRVDGVRIYLGRFNEKSIAIKARAQANKRYNFSKSHGV